MRMNKNTRQLDTESVKEWLKEIEKLIQVLQYHKSTMQFYLQDGAKNSVINVEEEFLAALFGQRDYNLSYSKKLYDEWMLETYNEKATTERLEQLSLVFKMVELFNNGIVINTDAFEEFVKTLNIDENGNNDEN